MWHYSSANLFVLIENPNNRSFATTATHLIWPLARVHIATLTANVGFVNLVVVATIASALIFQPCFADALREEPRGFLGDQAHVPFEC